MAFKRIISEQPAKGENHRRSARHRVETLAYVDLGSNNGGTVIDVSESGISFQGIQPLETGQVLPVSFKLPGIDQSLKTIGQIAWLNDSRKGGGLRFVELPEATRNLLKGWLSGTASDDLKKQPVALPPCVKTEAAHSSLALRARDQQNRPSVEMNKNLVDLLRDSSLSHGAVVAAVNASRSTMTAARPTDSDDLKEQPVALPPRVETETAHSSLVLSARVQQNRPSVEMNKNLVDLLRDSSLSRGAVVAAVNASRSTLTAARSTDSERAPRFPHRTWVTKSSPTRLTPAALRMLLPLAFVALLGVALFQHYRGQALNVSSTVSGDSPFGLKVERVGEDWRVLWNRNSDVLAKAVSGSLSIADGPFRKELDMDPNELRSGSIVYTPATDDVVVRLQVVGENLAQPVSESVRIVTGKVP